MGTPLRILVAEDSPTARQLLVSIFDGAPDMLVVGEAATGGEAVAMAARLRPDLISMDIEMPGMDGLEATQRIMIETPTPIIVVSAAAAGRESKLSLDAIEAGALAVAAKPPSPLDPDFEWHREQLLSMARSMAAVKVVRRWRHSRPITPAELREPLRLPHPIRLVAMAASTGGPAALHDILGRLPRNFRAPILVVQHIASGFVGPFAEWLDGGCSLRVKLGVHGEELRPGTVYVAPDGGHLELRSPDRITVRAGAPIGGFLPSATCLFESVARHYGSAAAGVILTGMGGDGLPGLTRMFAAGAPVLAQNEATSVVFGMPAEAVRAGVVTDVLPPRRIAERLLTYVMGDVDDAHTRR